VECASLLLIALLYLWTELESTWSMQVLF
jgi:hypothetical protein